MQCAPYPAVPKAQEFGKLEIDNMLEMKVVGIERTECVTQIEFSPEKDGLLSYFVDYCMLNAVA